MEHSIFFSRVNLRPDPFEDSITIEILSTQNMQVVVKMTNPEGTIINMFGWFILQGTNVTSIRKLQGLPEGNYQVSIFNNDGKVLYLITLKKN